MDRVPLAMAQRQQVSKKEEDRSTGIGL